MKRLGFAVRLLRVARLESRAFDLRDRGRLEEALAVYRRVLVVARSGTDPNLLSTFVSATLRFHEIAAELGRGELTLESLENALEALQRRERGSGDREKDLIRYEQQVRQRLETCGRTWQQPKPNYRPSRYAALGREKGAESRLFGHDAITAESSWACPLGPSELNATLARVARAPSP